MDSFIKLDPNYTLGKTDEETDKGLEQETRCQIEGIAQFSSSFL